MPDRAAPTDEAQSKTHPTMPSQRGARSFGHNATWMRRLALVAVASVAIIAPFFFRPWVVGPHPGATQHPIPVETEFSLADPLINDGVNPDISTLHQYQSYRDVKLWSVTDERGYVAWQPGNKG